MFVSADLMWAPNWKIVENIKYLQSNFIGNRDVEMKILQERIWMSVSLGSSANTS